MSIFASTLETVNTVKRELSQHFDITDLGTTHQIVSITITCADDDSIKLTQHPYLEKIINKMGLEKANPVHTPMDHN
ncbi:hypothetical protein H0H87_002733, partial [Tephrocybe sp. NHM501043]